MASERKPLSKRTRFEVFKRDGFKCQYCGRTPPSVTLEIDHVIPVARGGRDDRINLLTSCRDCNSGKSDRLLDDIPPALAAEVDNQRERLEQLKEFNKLLMRQRKRDRDLSLEICSLWREGVGDRLYELEWSNFRDRSLACFLKRLPAAEIMEAVDIALSRKSPHGVTSENDAWKYFCGICWSKIKQANQ